MPLAASVEPGHHVHCYPAPGSAAAVLPAPEWRRVGAWSASCATFSDALSCPGRRFPTQAPVLQHTLRNGRRAFQPASQSADHGMCLQRRASVPSVPLFREAARYVPLQPVTPDICQARQAPQTPALLGCMSSHGCPCTVCCGSDSFRPASLVLQHVNDSAAAGRAAVATSNVDMCNMCRRSCPQTRVSAIMSDDIVEQVRPGHVAHHFTMSQRLRPPR